MMGNASGTHHREFVGIEGMEGEEDPLPLAEF
jgi:hypothetical protein